MASATSRGPAAKGALFDKLAAVVALTDLVFYGRPPARFVGDAYVAVGDARAEVAPRTIGRGSLSTAEDVELDVYCFARRGDLDSVAARAATDRAFELYAEVYEALRADGRLTAQAVESVLLADVRRWELAEGLDDAGRWSEVRITVRVQARIPGR